MTDDHHERTHHRCEYVVEQMWASGRGAAGMKARYKVACRHCGHVRTGYADEIPRATFK